MLFTCISMKKGGGQGKAHLHVQFVRLHIKLVRFCNKLFYFVKRIILVRNWTYRGGLAERLSLT
jgi:hypothetical protein